MGCSLTSLLFRILLLGFSARFLRRARSRAARGLVYGTNAPLRHGPAGWVLDNEAGLGKACTPYSGREGESWKNGTAVMYANTSEKADRSMEEWIGEGHPRL